MTTRIVLSLGGNSSVTDDCYVRALSLPGLDLEICRVLPGMAEAQIRDLLAASSGLVLSGGADVHPARYGEEPAGTEMRTVSVKRDSLELSALTEADRLSVPVLAICRGMQVLNVHRGGALLQDIGQSHRDGRRQQEKWRPFHDVALDPASAAARYLGAGQVSTNSRHHQALDPERLGNGLVVGRCTGDGIIEAVESPGERFIVGVQWHPENMATGPADTLQRTQARSLFSAFARAANAFETSK